MWNLYNPAEILTVISFVSTLSIIYVYYNSNLILFVSFTINNIVKVDIRSNNKFYVLFNNVSNNTT